MRPWLRPEDPAGVWQCAGWRALQAQAGASGVGAAGRVAKVAALGPDAAALLCGTAQARSAVQRGLKSVPLQSLRGSHQQTRRQGPSDVPVGSVGVADNQPTCSDTHAHCCVTLPEGQRDGRG